MTNEQRLNAANARANVFLLGAQMRGLREAENLPDDQVAAFPGHLWSKYYYIGFARKALRTRPERERSFPERRRVSLRNNLKGGPVPRILHIQLAEFSRISAKRLPAQAEAQRATELLPESKDAFGGPEITTGVAEVYAVLGRTIARLQFWMDCLAG